MTPLLRCRVCGKPRPRLSGGICECGSEAFELVEPPAPRAPPLPSGIVVATVHDAPPLDVRPFRGALAQVMGGGVVLGLRVLVSGKKGSGKSTVCAELGAAMAAELGGLLYWLDAEQDRSLVGALFARTGSPADRVRWVGRDPNAPRSISWREAFAAVGPDAAVVVVDSLQRWARSDAEQTALLEALKAIPVTCLVISHANKRGEASGQSANQHDCDTTVTVRKLGKRTVLLCDKCRWAPTPQKVIIDVAAALSGRGDGVEKVG
jgi:predicted ATP-dependent serine protease